MEDNGDLQQNMFLEMMKHHISNGLAFSYPATLASDGENSSNIDPDLDEHELLPTPVVYKKRARIKFTQHQLDTLEATFQQHRYPTIDMIDDLVEQLNLPTQKITVWFQNRRARLKKSQHKVEDLPPVAPMHVIPVEREDPHPPHYDSGIQLDDEGSRDSTTSPPMTQLYPSMTPYFPPAAPPPSSTPYYLPPTHQTFYNPMWQNFRYPMSGNTYAGNSPYSMMNYNSPFLFHETAHSYSNPTEFYTSI